MASNTPLKPNIHNRTPSQTSSPFRSPSGPGIGSQPRRVSGDNTLAQNMNNLSLTPLPKRPGYGTIGVKVNALVNFFRTDLSGVPDILEYAFKISSEDKTDNQVTGRIRARAVFLLLDRNANFAHAASNYNNTVVSTKPLVPDGATGHVYTIDYFEPEESGPRTDDRRLEFRIRLQYARRYVTKAFISHQDDQSHGYPDLDGHLAAFNMLLSRGPAQNPNVVTAVRRDKFFSIMPNNGRGDLEFGLEVFKGTFKSGRLTQGGYRLLVNVAATPMYWEGPLHVLISKMLAGKYFSSQEERLKYLDYELEYLRIETAYLGRRSRKSILKVARAPSNTLPPTAANISFLKDDQLVTVENYFRTTYPHIPRPDIGALVVNVGSRDRAVFIPSDLCTVVPGQPYKGLLPRVKQTSNMICYACRPPAKNIELILKESLPQIGAGPTGDLQRRFNIKIENKMLQVTARMLPPPDFEYASGLDKSVSSGSWNMARKQFKRSPSKDVMKLSWVELLLPGMESAPNRGTFLANMRAAVRTYTGHQGVDIATFDGFDHSFEVPPGNLPLRLGVSWTGLLNKGIRLVFVLLPNKQPQYYRAVKVSADAMNQGIHTVCTVRDEKSGNVKVDVGELANEMLKVNARLGGTNLTWKIPPPLKPIFDKKLMFVGADVVHPGKNAMLFAPSVASVVASFDDKYFLYPGSVRLQQPDNQTKKAVEFIKNFGDMVEERLKLFRRHNDCLPDIIFVYRDGVGDSMFTEVLTKEMLQLQVMYKKVYAGREHPRTIFMVVKKRVHTRFYGGPVPGPGFDRKRNPLPGFIVDNQITDGKIWDWYLTSHICLQGTSVPKHYVVLHDDLGIGADSLQYLTYAMCFLWPRATKSISIHPAARAADLLCDRAKVYLHPVYFPPPTANDQTKPIYRASGNHWPGVIAPNLRDSMFYI